MPALLAHRAQARAGATPRRVTKACALGALLLLAPALAPTMARAGSFSLLTYNVAGLPEGLSSSTPTVNIPQISPRLNGFDLVLVQEDFAFFPELAADTTHPFVSVTDDSTRPPVVAPVGDGLDRFSRSPFSEHTRVTWEECFGLATNASDCLAPKGFAVARHDFGPGLGVDVYNLHAEAGSDEPDLAARQANMRQLIAFAQVFSADRAVIIAGDTNSRYTREGDILPELLAELALHEVWIELSRGGVLPEIGPSLRDCPPDDFEGPDCELVDRVFYRSSDALTLRAVDYQVENELFQDGEGVPLSDHEAVSARFQIHPAPEPIGLGLLALLGPGLLAMARKRPDRLLRGR